MSRKMLSKESWQSETMTPLFSGLTIWFRTAMMPSSSAAAARLWGTCMFISSP